jgi:hypothetical protein
VVLKVFLDKNLNFKIDIFFLFFLNCIYILIYLYAYIELKNIKSINESLKLQNKALIEKIELIKNNQITSETSKTNFLNKIFQRLNSSESEIIYNKNIFDYSRTLN